MCPLEVATYIHRGHYSCTVYDFNCVNLVAKIDETIGPSLGPSPLKPIQMDVRRRTAETVRPLSEITREDPPTSFPSNAEEDEERAATIKSLIDEGTRLFETSKESGFQEVAKFAQGLKFLATAAGKGSDEAVERLQACLLAPPRMGVTSVMGMLPEELASVVKVMVEGSETEKQVYKVASDMFSTMAVGANVIPKDKIDSAAEKLLKSEQEVVGAESVKSAYGMKKAVWRLLHCSVITDKDGQEVVCIA